MNTKSVFFLISINFLSFPILSQNAWNPDESMKIKSISQTDISNDGKSVAYVVRGPIMEDKKSEYLSQIWVTDTESKENI